MEVPTQPTEGMALLENRKFVVFSMKFDLLLRDSERFFIGAQIASLLGRETFNLYRSFKLKNVPYERATQRELDYMISVGVLLSGTRSATLVPYVDALYFLADLKRPQTQTKEQAEADAPPPSWLVTRPRIHRRKPHPWELGRSLKMHAGTLVAGPALVDLNQFADYAVNTR